MSLCACTTCVVILNQPPIYTHSYDDTILNLDEKISQVFYYIFLNVNLVIFSTKFLLYNMLVRSTLPRA